MSSEWSAAVAACQAASTPLQARNTWAEQVAEQDAWATCAPTTIRVSLCGTVTTQPLEPYLWVDLVAQGLSVSVTHAPYNQLYNELLSPASSLAQQPAPEVVILVWRLEELCAEALGRLSADPLKARALMEQELTQFLAAIQTYLERAGAVTLIVANPMRPSDRPLGVLDARLEQGISGFHLDSVAYWRRRIADEPRIHLLDLDGLQRDFGAERAANPRMWHLAKMPWTEAFNQKVASQMARIVRATIRAPRKVLVMDCDNTLWGGVVGEDGALGVDAGEDAPGNAHVELQRYALKLREQGVLLAIASKNDEPDVWEVFDRHPGMLLKREHLAAARINWRPKSQNLRELAAELRLGADSLVLIDDSPAECAEVRANAPEILVLHLDADPAHFVELLENACAFDRLSLTSEDAQRAEMYSQERQREQLRGSATMDDYLAGLQLVVRIAEISEECVARVAQLVNKTNQFNLTTIRRTESEVRALVNDPNARAYAVWVQDRFGDYGLTGAAFCRRNPDGWWIDTLLLSCRVLGRGVETALLSHLLQEAAADGAIRLHGRFVPSAKNQMTAAYYPEHGFYEVEPGLFVRDAEPGIPIPPHLTLESVRASAAKAGIPVPLASQVD